MTSINSKQELQIPLWINDNPRKNVASSQKTSSHKTCHSNNSARRNPKRDVFISERKQLAIKRKKAAQRKRIGFAATFAAMITAATVGVIKLPGDTVAKNEYTISNLENMMPQNIEVEIKKEALAEMANEQMHSDEDIILPDETKEPEAFNFEYNMSPEQEASLNGFLEKWNDNQERYQYLEELTGVPAELIAAIHWREASCDFNCCLQDGTPLGEPIQSAKYKGKTYYSFEDSVIDVMKDKYLNASKIEKGNYQTYFDFAERYNGTGYRIYQDMNSPYVWAGTDKYTSGKYIGDNEFDAEKVDNQAGVALLLKNICE